MKINKQVLGLGLVSFFNDLSSEVLTRVLPLYMLAVLNSSLMGVGLIEAISEGTVVLANLLSGFYSDRISRRKPFIFAGYALSVFSRPLILWGPVHHAIVGVARFLEKLGKGIRTAPRDAMIADLSDRTNRGGHFGINRALDTFGAVVGLAGVAAFLWLNPMSEKEGLTVLIKISGVVGVMALVVLWFGVKESRRAVTPIEKTADLSLKGLDEPLKRYLVIAFFFALASSSDAFLIVRAKGLGFGLVGIFLILSVFNVFSAVSAYQLSRLSDKVGRKIMLLSGWIIYFISYVFFGFGFLSPATFVVVLCVYGLFYGFTDGVEKALIADFESKSGKATAYGWINLVRGIGVVIANLLFAEAYEKRGHQLAFWLSAFFALIGVVLLYFFRPHTNAKEKTRHV